MSEVPPGLIKRIRADSVWRNPTPGDGFETMALSEKALQLLKRAKQAGFSDRQIATIVNRGHGAPAQTPEPKDPKDERDPRDFAGSTQHPEPSTQPPTPSPQHPAPGARILTEADVRRLRREAGIRPVFKSVDTCAGEFEAFTPYYYSTYERTNESVRSDRKKIVILGGGPNRIGQGIEFDYCCVQAVFALKELGYETIMVNSNPETVSTDYDTADKLYFEPLTVEDVLAICDVERPDGVIVQLGGQTPLNLARALEAEGVPIIGTSPDSIDLAEDRDRFGKLLERLKIPQPENGAGRTLDEVQAIATRIGYPVMVRPSYVLGGRAMQTVWSAEQLAEFTRMAIEVADGHSILVDKFLDNATEVDVDALGDGRRIVIAAVMEHIEEAGIHSGDSACVIPPRTLSPAVMEKIRRHTHQLGLALQVKGLMNIQYAVRDEEVYVLEVNPRASRTVPYVSKAIGVPVAQLAAKVMTGLTLEELGFTEERSIHYYAVKEAVLPFHKFPGCTVELGPEMRSTGEVMGIDADFGMAFAKSQLAAGTSLPDSGDIFVSINDHDKPLFVEVARQLVQLGFGLVATHGTSEFLNRHGIPNRMIFKISVGRPNVADLAMNNEIAMIVNTFTGWKAREDEKKIRTIAIQRELPLFTTIAAARAAACALAALKSRKPDVRALQDYHASLRTGSMTKD
jgi:carbamoyl-phosphate synthase large subunit